MTEKLKFSRAQIRNVAIVAKEEGVSITLKPDGSMSVLPVTHTDIYKIPVEPKGIIRL